MKPRLASEASEKTEIAEAPPASEGRASLAAEISVRFRSIVEPGMTKHAQIRKAILACIRDGVLKPGDQLPPEQMLSSVLRLSLGTVQRALGQLAIGDVVLREHGRGTFVARMPRAIEDNWHFRFFAEDGRSLLPVYSRILERQLTHRAGPWSTAIADDGKGFVWITRMFDIDGRFVCHSEFYLPASRFAGMLAHPIDSIEAINLKKVLADEFGTPTLYVTQRARVEALSDRSCEITGAERGSFGMLLELIGHTFDDAPISYHAIWLPPTSHFIDLSRVQSVHSSGKDPS